MKCKINRKKCKINLMKCKIDSIKCINNKKKCKRNYKKFRTNNVKHNKMKSPSKTIFKMSKNQKVVKKRFIFMIVIRQMIIGNKQKNMNRRMRNIEYRLIMVIIIVQNTKWK